MVFCPGWIRVAVNHLIMRKSDPRMANCYRKCQPSDLLPVALGFVSFLGVGFPSVRSVQDRSCRHGWRNRKMRVLRFASSIYTESTRIERKSSIFENATSDLFYDAVNYNLFIESCE